MCRCVGVSVYQGFRTRPPLPPSPHLVDGLRGVLVDGAHPRLDVLKRRLIGHIIHLRSGGLGLRLGLGLGLGSRLGLAAEGGGWRGVEGGGRRGRAGQRERV